MAHTYVHLGISLGVMPPPAAGLPTVSAVGQSTLHSGCSTNGATLHTPGWVATRRTALRFRSYYRSSLRVRYGVLRWQNASVVVQCDNQGAITAAVTVVNSGYSKVQPIMHLLCCLFFIRSCYNISLHAVYLPGTYNVLAHAISCDNVSFFRLVSGPGSSVMPHPSAPITLRTSAAQSARLDLSSLDPAVQQLFPAGLANSTKKSY